MRSDSPGGAAVEVNNLTKRFGKRIAVDHISFSVRRGEFFGFLGPNGAGKTTTVRMLTGVLPPDEGKARILGFPAGSLEAKQSAGVVPEVSNPYLDLSGWDNIRLMGELYGLPPGRIRERGTELLRQLGLLERKGSPVRRYSKGMRQRLLLVMALVSDPELLFLDEPTSGLDVQSARLIRELLRTLNAEGKTIFLTTHDMDEANRLCARVAIINEGRIVAIDSPEELKRAISGMHSVEVCFAGGADPGVLQSLPGVSGMSASADSYRLFTADPGELAVCLVEHCRARGLRIVSLRTLVPSLEDAFVALVSGEK